MRGAQVFNLTETELRSGTTLIEASAGTGKTYTIAGLFLRLIVEKNLSVDQILVVTYTVAATEELRNRIRQTLARARTAFERGASKDPFLTALVHAHASRSNELAGRLTRALDGFDEAPIYTIHGFCQRVLKDRAFETGSLFDTELVTDPTPVVRQLVQDYWRKHFYSATRVPVLFALKNEVSPESILPLVLEILSHPALKILSPVDGQPVDALAAQLDAVFGSLRETWRTDKDVIQSQFGAGAKWGNKPYNNGAMMAQAWDDLSHCLGAPEFAASRLSPLDLFRRSALLAGVNRRYKLSPPSHRFFDLCEDLALAEQRYVLGLKLQALRYVQQTLPRRKEELKIQFFDDLLRRLQDALVSGHGEALAALLRRQYPAALIDEFQDTDPLQYDIFRRVFTTRNAGFSRQQLAKEAGLSAAAGVPDSYLFLIGDPKQAIYAFRGADIFTYLKASQQTDQSYTLKQNWRSESGLVNAVNTAFGSTSNPFVFKGIGFQPVEAKGEADQHPLKAGDTAQPPLQLWFCRRSGKSIPKREANDRLPAVVASEVVALLDGTATLGGRPLLPEDIAVLVPENAQARLLQAALSERQVPSVLYTTASLFDSLEAAEVQRLLAAIADPTRESQLLAALSTSLVGYTGAQIEALATQEAQRQQLLQRFRDYLELWGQRGFIQMFRSMMQREQVRSRLLALPNGERRLTNLLHLAEVLHRASGEHRLGIAGLLKWLSDQQAEEDQPDEEHQLRLETDEKAVKLVTIHKSKGLEYSVVFCPFSWKGAKVEHRGEEQIYFHEGGEGDLVRDLGGPEYEAHKQQALVESLAQEVRLLYVALTRARHRCYFAWGAFKDAEVSAAARLLHPPPADVPDAYEAQQAHFEALTDDALLADLQKVVAESEGKDGKPCIAVIDLPEPTTTTFSPMTAPASAPTHRTFTGSIPRDWRISSFTSLTANRSEDLPDYDETAVASRDGSPSRLEPPSGFFAFPAGPKPGTCLHKIFELLDFTQWDQPATGDLIREQLREHALPATELEEMTAQMVGRVMSAPLDPAVPGLSLAKIARVQRLQELEFHFPLQKLTAEKLFELLRERRIAQQPESSGERIPFSFAPVQGMLKGFIDLIFEFEGRFYVLDWKSNLLGSRIEDYSPKALTEEIRRHHYDFQYQLYTVAFDRYLRLRLPGYNYEQHFGGVYYLFLRGIDPAQPGFGIHRDRLEEPFLRKLDALLVDRPNA